MSRRLPPARRRAGSALIITLAFVALLTGLMVFFFLQAATYHALSSSNSSDFRSATLGQSALQVVVGDLSQEIVAGSTVATAAATNTVYTPATNFNAIPQRSGNPPPAAGATDPIPNLVRRSVRADPIAAPGVGSRASAVNSTADPSANGQYVSMARWNRHYLIPRDPTIYPYGSAKVGTDPVKSFTAPDWVYVTDRGPVVLASPTNSVVGRYAYAVYNEGGLLDANVAGSPSSMAVDTAPHPAPNTIAYTNGTTGYTVTQQQWGSGAKGSAAFADLIPLGLTQPQIDKIVGWRNAVSAQPAGSFQSGYTFTAASALLYHDFVLGSTNGFLATGGQASAAQTDQAFSSRQALIKFFNDSGFPQGPLQFLGTFSRDVEQPNYAPNASRPKIQSAYNVNNATYGTGNDAYGADRNADPSLDINPPLLSVRVTTSFTRPDGTTAQVGEPLLKRRFPLSRLALLASSATASQSQSDPIYRNFGLYRANASGPWLYDHGAGAGILRLSQVSGREPDFFELLKAAIQVGSLAKGSCYSNQSGVNAWTSTGNAGTLQQARDTLTALQLLQLGANIVDQAKSDNFPTRIQFALDATVPPNEVRGVEDLPYLYRIRNWVSRYDTYNGVFLLQPELWNPHSLGSSAYVSASATPSSFRVRIGPDPTLLTTPLIASTPVKLNVTYRTSGSPGAVLDNNVTFGSANYGVSGSTTYRTDATLHSTAEVVPVTMTFKAGELNGGWGFRDPTLLGVSTKPAACGMAVTPYNDFTTGSNMTGIVLAEFPWAYDVAATIGPDKIDPYPNGAGGTLRAYLEYQSGGNWIVYDEAPFQFKNDTSTFLDIHTVANYHTYAAAEAALDWYAVARTDPRTSRWGFFYGEYMYALPVVDAVNNVFATMRPDGGLGYGSHIGQRMDSGMAGALNNYSDPHHGFQHAYWAENSVRPTFQTDNTDSGLRYARDPDGVPRRAMGGYATDATSGGSPVSASQPLAGLPLATANYASRPTILHRPFRSVAELGYVFRDTPWSNLGLSFPESGDAALLDVFCVSENNDPNALVAGRVDLNTRQAPVLQALMANTLRDKDDATRPTLDETTMALDIATQLVNRTSASGTGPLVSRGELVGAWKSGASASGLSTAADPDSYYTGFSEDIGKAASVKGTTTALITRQREAALRGLADAGTTRTWSLLIDLVAQGGRFPPGAAGLANFAVEGEKHYWLHVAIDRVTGKVLASQLEVVKE